MRAGAIVQLISNSPERKPSRNARHDSTEKLSIGLSSTLESRTATAFSMKATSTQPLLSQRVLLRQSKLVTNDSRLSRKRVRRSCRSDHRTARGETTLNIVRVARKQYAFSCGFGLDDIGRGLLLIGELP
jgi:hypothetical protein